MHDYINRMSSSFEQELRKIAASVPKKSVWYGGGLAGLAIPAIAGVAAWEGLKKVEKDRRLGREVRRRQQGGY